jgi:hypothetical protein
MSNRFLFFLSTASFQGGRVCVPSFSRNRSENHIADTHACYMLDRHRVSWRVEFAHIAFDRRAPLDSRRCHGKIIVRPRIRGVSANNHGVDPLRRRRQISTEDSYFGAIYFGVKTCNLDANNDDIEVSVYFLNSNQKTRSCENLLKKRPKGKKKVGRRGSSRKICRSRKLNRR